MAQICDLGKSYFDPTGEEHKVTIVHVGTGLRGSQFPQCLCGWEGRHEYNYNDDSYLHVTEQGREHLAAMQDTTNF